MTIKTTKDDATARLTYTPPMPATPAWPPRSAPRLFVPDRIAQGSAITLDGPQAHYLLRVMRVNAGDTVILCDDITGEWAATVASTEKRRLTLTAAEHLRPRDTPPDLWLCPALLKKDRFDLVLEKATELGVAEIRPLVMRRCVADSLNEARARQLSPKRRSNARALRCPVCKVPRRWPKACATGPMDVHSVLRGRRRWRERRANFR